MKPSDCHIDDSLTPAPPSGGDRDNARAAGRSPGLKAALASLLLCLIVTGCAGLNEQMPEPSPREMYERAAESLSSENFSEAVQRLNDLQTRYPFGDYAQQAQLELIYAHYRLRQWEEALAAADRFLREYPRHRHVDYAYYMRGLIDFERSIGMLEEIWPYVDNAHMDPTYARNALDTFVTLLRRFPDSEYAADARQRIVFLNNRLARHELYIADYYYRREAYVAAINRAQDILKRYPRTPSAYRALEILADAYGALGMKELEAEAREALARSSSKPVTPAVEAANPDARWSLVNVLTLGWFGAPSAPAGDPPSP